MVSVPILVPHINEIRNLVPSSIKKKKKSNFSSKNWTWFHVTWIGLGSWLSPKSSPFFKIKKIKNLNVDFGFGF